MLIFSVELYAVANTPITPGSPRALQVGSPRSTSSAEEEPIPTLTKAFSSYVDVNMSLLVPYLQRVCYPAGHVLWRQNDPADGLYVIERGVLRASYLFNSWASNTGVSTDDDEHNAESPHVQESMVSGTLAGELTALSDMPRNATVIVERDVVLWKLGRDNFKKMQREDPQLASAFVEAVLKGQCLPM